MANPRVKSAALYYKNSRVAILQNVTYRIKTNDTQEMADSGAYNTDGITTTEISCDTISPVADKKFTSRFIKDAIAHNDVDLTLGLVGGEIHSLEQCRNSEIEVASEVASGKMTGRFTWFGGSPKIVG